MKSIVPGIICFNLICKSETYTVNTIVMVDYGTISVYYVINVLRMVQVISNHLKSFKLLCF